jgi:methyl coenzyme M reductase alpha subunit
MKQTVDEMDEYTLKRWSALIDGMSIISEYAKKHGIDAGEVDFKQNYLIDYIDEQTEHIVLI